MVEICHSKVSQLERSLLVIGTVPRSTASRIVRIAVASMAAATTIADLRAAGPETGKDQTVSESRKIAYVLLNCN